MIYKTAEYASEIGLMLLLMVLLNFMVFSETFLKPLGKIKSGFS
jgi:hypothetical protein